MSLPAYVRDAVDRARRLTMRRRAVHELRRSLALIVDLAALESSVASRIRELFDPDLLVILQTDSTTSDYRPSFCSGIALEDVGDVVFQPRGRLAQWFRTNETCLMVDRDSGVMNYIEDQERRHLLELQAKLCAPLLASNHLVGILVLGSTRLWRPTRRDADLLLQLSNQASLAFQNALLYREQRKRLDRLHRADRLAAIGQLAAGIAHEVRNPLTSIRSTMQYLARGFDDDESKRTLAADLIDEVDRIDQTITGLLSLTRPSEFKPEQIDLMALIAQTVRLVENQARKQSVDVEVRSPSRPLSLVGDPSQLKQVFLNLILNALQAMPEEGGKIVLSIRQETPAVATGQTEQIRLDVVDNGSGIPKEVLKTVFDPLFTTKSDGTGLGLAISHGIIERHEGEIEIDSRLGEGTRVSVRLPAAPRGGGASHELQRG